MEAGKSSEATGWEPSRVESSPPKFVRDSNLITTKVGGRYGKERRPGEGEGVKIGRKM